LLFFQNSPICASRTLLSIDHCLPFAAVSPSIQTDYAGPSHSVGGNTEGDITMANGTVKWFNSTKGFGFIAPETGGKDVFVHISAVERSGLTGLADDQKVTYDVEAGRDGRESATNIVLA
jgi:CspA family cold shock protein